MSCGHWMFLPLPTSLLTSLWNSLVNYCLMVSSSLTSLCLVAMYCPNLEKLDISGVSVTQTSFKQFSTSCPKLKVCLTELSRQQYKSNVSSLFSVAKSVWSTLHWREMVTKANITASLCDPSVNMLWWCHCMCMSACGGQCTTVLNWSMWISLRTRESRDRLGHYLTLWNF